MSTYSALRWILLFGRHRVLFGAWPVHRASWTRYLFKLSTFFTSFRMTKRNVNVVVQVSKINQLNRIIYPQFSDAASGSTLFQKKGLSLLSKLAQLILLIRLDRFFITTFESLIFDNIIFDLNLCWQLIMIHRFRRFLSVLNTDLKSPFRLLLRLHLDYFPDSV